MFNVSLAKLRRAADHVAVLCSTAPARPGVEVGARTFSRRHRRPSGGRVERRRKIRADAGQVVGAAGIDVGAQRKHRAPVEVQHEPADLSTVVMRSAARPVGRRAWLGECASAPTTSVPGEEAVADDGEPAECQAAIEQVGLTAALASVLCPIANRRPVRDGQRPLSPPVTA